MRNKLKNKKGFTLVEMIVVLAIIAILIALLAPNVARLIRSSQITSDDAKVKTIASSAQVYATDQIRRGETFNTGAGNPDWAPIILSSGATGDTLFISNPPWSSAGAPRFIDETGNSYLTANTLRGQDSCLLYISDEGAVIGAVYYTANNNQIKSVTGIYPGTNAANVTFTTEVLRNNATLAPATGTITP